MGMVFAYTAISPKDGQEITEKKSHELLEEILYEGNNEKIDLDKSRDLIHYALTQEATENMSKFSWEQYLLFGEMPLGEGGLYDVPFYTSKQKVQELSEKISGWSEEIIRDNLNRQEMREKSVYMAEEKLNKEEKEALTKYALENFRSLKEFYTKAAKRGQAVIVSPG